MEDSVIKEVAEPSELERGDGAIINAGAVVAVFLGVPSLFIGMFGAVGLLTGQKLIAGALGALWGYAAAAGAYELNRRKFRWTRGARYADHHLLGGMCAVSTALMIGGALQETFAALGLVPALSAIKRASEGHRNHLLTFVHTAVLLSGIGVGVWFYRDGVIGGVLLQRVAAFP